MFPFRREVHRVVNVPMVHWANREFPDAGVFVFFHTRTGNFCWGQWVNHLGGKWIDQLLTIGPSLNLFDREMAMRLKIIMRGTPSDLKGQLAGLTRRMEAREGEEAREEAEMLARLGRDFGRPGCQNHPAFQPGGVDNVWGRSE